MKGINECLSLPNVRYEILDAGYDHEPIYTQIYRIRHQSIIAYNKRNWTGCANSILQERVFPF